MGATSQRKLTAAASLLSVFGLVSYIASQWFRGIFSASIPEERVITACQMVLQLDTFLTAGFLVGFSLYATRPTEFTRNTKRITESSLATLLGVIGIVAFATSAFYAIAGVITPTSFNLVGALSTAIGGIIIIPLIWLGVQQSVQTPLQTAKSLRTASPRVFVDAKIIGSHDPNVPKRTLVAFKVENSGREGFKEVDATETDDAESHAVLFAIQELKSKLQPFTIVCDHESVVSEINRGTVQNGRPSLMRIRKELKLNPEIQVELLENNPAHRVLNRYLSEGEQKQHSQ